MLVEGSVLDRDQAPELPQFVPLQPFDPNNLQVDTNSAPLQLGEVPDLGDPLGIPPDSEEEKNIPLERISILGEDYTVATPVELLSIWQASAAFGRDDFPYKNEITNAFTLLATDPKLETLRDHKFNFAAILEHGQTIMGRGDNKLHTDETAFTIIENLYGARTEVATTCPENMDEFEQYVRATGSTDDLTYHIGMVGDRGPLEYGVPTLLGGGTIHCRTQPMSGDYRGSLIIFAFPIQPTNVVPNAQS